MTRIDDFSGLGTAQIADACLRHGVPLLTAPSGLRPVRPGDRVAGQARPVRHHGSVDVFLEAFEAAERGDVLVIDNQGRTDEGCVGDLIVLEAQVAGIGGIVIWGAHRDTAELDEIGLPVFSYGAVPAGPVRLEPAGADTLTSAQFGDLLITREYVVFADTDGAIFVAAPDVAQVLETARDIRRTEEEQTARVRGGETLRDQLRFSDYLERRATDPDHTFRRHLREIGGEIEE